MITTLLISAVVIIACVITNRIAGKIGIPVLIGFIGLGMLFGSDGLFKIQFENFEFAEAICKIALIFIMFYGGFGTRWSEAKPAAAKSILLSTVGVVITAALTGIFCYYAVGMPLGESLLIGAVLSSTDAASVFSILRSKKLGLKENTASLLEMESGSNDPCAYMLTIAAISIINGKATVGSIAYLLFSQFAYGIAIGAVIAVCARFVLMRFRFSAQGFDAAFVAAVAVLAFALPEAVGGNGYLSTYIVGIVLGNSDIKNKKPMVHFFDGTTGLMQILVFFLLGLLSFPSALPGVFLPSLAISLCLIFIVRPIAIFVLMSPFKCSMNQMLLVSWSGLRGAASIVFSIMAVACLPELNNDIFHIVFCVVLISILLQGTLIPFMSRKLNMIDDNSNVLKTFNDYVEELAVQFIRLTIQGTHPWSNKKICELSIPPDLLFVLILRNGESIIPNGETEIKTGDVVVVSAREYRSSEDAMFVEEKVYSGSKWVGKKISDYSSETSKLVILIKRGTEVIIPKGPTDILKNDILVLHAQKQPRSS
ncbi:MAG: potassium/proton antiporter [Porcipelethomonas sp.]